MKIEIDQTNTSIDLEKFVENKRYQEKEAGKFVMDLLQHFGESNQIVEVSDKTINNRMNRVIAGKKTKVFTLNMYGLFEDGTFKLEIKVK